MRAVCPPRIRRSLLATVVPLGILLAIGCGDAAPRRPDILFVTIDTLRADHLRSYGYFRETSPFLDALVEESIVFDRCIAPMATTLPSHISIFTGTWPAEHGVLANMARRRESLSNGGEERFVRAPGLLTLAETLRGAGYATHAIVSGPPLRKRFGLETGFDSYLDPPGLERSARAVTDLALRWLAEPREQPFFLWLHYFDPHSGYRAPEPFADAFRDEPALARHIEERAFADVAKRRAGRSNEVRSGINGYDAEILFADDQLGRIRAALVERGSWPETVVVLLSDHGEGLNQHGVAGHGLTWHEQLWVPCLIRDPHSEPRRVSFTMSLVDIVPTLLGLLRLPGAERFTAQMSGVDVLSRDFVPRPVLSSSSLRRVAEGYDLELSLTTDDWKYRRTAGGREELYDLRADPFELENVASGHPRILADLRARLDAAYARQRERGEALGGGTRAELCTEEIEQLRALGYGVD